MAEEKRPIESFEQAHEIGKEFKRIYDLLNLKSPDEYGLTPYKGDYANPDGTIAYSQIDYFSQTFAGDLNQEYYIRFGKFLSFLQSNIIPNINFDSNNKLIKIDFFRVGNIIYTQPFTFSADPKVCYIKKSIFVTSRNKTFDFIPGADNFIIDFNGDTNIKGKYGNVMNIYFNMEWILGKIDEIKDNKGKISLYGLLDALCKGYNESTGNFNKLEPIIDTETNTIKILDDVALPDRKAILESSYITSVYGNISTEEVIFDTYGYYKGIEGSIYGKNVPHAGFIKDLSFTTTVSPELATMITVGSTKQGYIKGADATSLSRMNNNLIDRFKEQITNADEIEPEIPKPLEEQYKAALTSFDNFIVDLGTNANKKIPNYLTDSIQDYKNLQTQLLEYYQYAEVEKNIKENPTISSANSGFLPFDLSLKMDGLSGMKVYQKFTIDTDFLPTNYPGTIDFLIKGITHTIAGNEWTTSIESMAIPKNPFAITGSSETERSANRGGPQEFSAVRGGTFKTIDGVRYKNGEIPENKLRAINNMAKYIGSISSDKINANDRSGRIRLYDKASLALDRLIAAAEQSKIPVKINSAYRTFADQQRVYNENCPGGVCRILTARPGTSNHGFGIAVDFATPGLQRIKPGDKLYDWLVINGPKYGFQRIKSESWHWEYQA
jgi:hypothetical protein